MNPEELATSKRRETASISETHVAIIGAGLAGLRCADILLQNGFRVTIVEGRERVGGRLHQENLVNGQLVDMGPNWIHGTNDNPILDLAKHTGTTVTTWEHDSYLFDQEGTLLPEDQSEKYSTMMWEIVERAFEHSNKFGADIGTEKSLLDFFNDQIAESLSTNDPDFEKKKQTILQVAEMWGAFVGSPVSRQSLKYFWLEECIEGENLFCAGTYKKILDHIAAPALAGADIKFNSVVEGIQWQVDGSTQVQVTFKDSQRTLYDEVVVTSPLGWLKRNPGAFEPALPSRLSQAIGSIGYGCLEKVYVTFPKAFWKGDTSDGRQPDGFIQWLSPNYTLESNPRKWSQEAVELANLTDEDSHPTLLFYIYGEQSEYMTSKAAGFKSDTEQNEFFFQFFQPYFSRLPNYDSEAVACKPLGYLATAWLQDELAGCGSYSNFQVGLKSGDEDIVTMREGLPGYGLWFAGEHTAPFVALGTATGAYWSGESVGKRIVHAYARNGVDEQS